MRCASGRESRSCGVRAHDRIRIRAAAAAGGGAVNGGATVSLAAAIFGVGGDSPADYRVNVGIVNVDPNKTQTFIVSYSTTAEAPPASIVVTLPPMTMQQIGAGTPFGQISIANATASPSNLWTAFASTINNVTGDAWSELAVAGTASQ